MPRKAATTSTKAGPDLDRPTIMRIALEAQLDQRTVRKALELGIGSLQNHFAQARLRDALTRLKLRDLIR